MLRRRRDPLQQIYSVKHPRADSGERDWVLLCAGVGGRGQVEKVDPHCQDKPLFYPLFYRLVLFFSFSYPRTLWLSLHYFMGKGLTWSGMVNRKSASASSSTLDEEREPLMPAECRAQIVGEDFIATIGTDIRERILTISRLWWNYGTSTGTCIVHCLQQVCCCISQVPINSMYRGSRAILNYVKC